MAVKSKEELLSNLKSVIGDTPSDEAIALLEDVSDTLDNSTGSSSDEDKKKIEELEKKVKDTDDMWRKRYTERFFNPSDNPSKDESANDEQEDEQEEDNSPKTFEELFSAGEQK
jgi:hypothetical protein